MNLSSIRGNLGQIQLLHEVSHSKKQSLADEPTIKDSQRILISSTSPRLETSLGDNRGKTKPFLFPQWENRQEVKLKASLNIHNSPFLFCSSFLLINIFPYFFILCEVFRIG